MAGVTAHGATFTYAVIGGGSFGAIVTGVSVQSPTAEITDMSGATTPKGYQVLVPTGDLASGGAGTVTVDYMSPGIGGIDWQSLVGTVGAIVFASSNHSVVRRVLLENASAEVRAGELVRGTLRFRMTDFTP
jgi:hypothetical protein